MDASDDDANWCGTSRHPSIDMPPPTPVGNPNGTAKAEVPGMEPVAEAEAKAMLPDPLFCHFEFVVDGKYWSEEDERILQRDYADWAKQMDASVKEKHRERSLWRLTIKLFGCHPYDLFRYGLQVERQRRQGPDAISGKEPKNMNLSQALCMELQSLMCHPLWDGKIELLRYALQLAVYYRVENHISPLGPGIDLKQEPKDDVWKSAKAVADPEQRMSIIGDYCYETFLQHGPPGNPYIRELAARLQETLTPVPAKEPTDRLLFKLRLADLRAVKQALDGTTTMFGAAKWQPCADYWMQYQVARTRAWQYPPTSIAQLSEWKQAWFLHAKREKLVRIRFRERGMGDMLLDMPRTDPVPFYVNSRRVTQEQRDVLYGAVWPTHEEPLPPRAERQT